MKETYPDASITVVVNPQCAELAKLISYIDSVVEWDNRKHGFNTTIKMIRWLKKQNFDAVVMLNPSKDFNIITYLAGIPNRIGYDKKCAFLLTKKIKDTKHLRDKHEVEYNLELVSLIGAHTDNLSLELNLPVLKAGDSSRAEKAQKHSSLGLEALGDFCEGLNVTAAKEARDFIAVHPWTSDPVKEWPRQNFFKLVKHLLEITNLHIMIVGGAKEALDNKDFFSGLGARVTDLTGKTTLIELAAILKRAKLLVSCDSGPVHLAACVGTPVVAIFRNDLPGKSAKRWGPWGKGHAVIEGSCLSCIRPEEVCAKVNERLK